MVLLGDVKHMFKSNKEGENFSRASLGPGPGAWELLCNFVEDIRKEIPLSRVWYTKCCVTPDDREEKKEKKN